MAFLAALVLTVPALALDVPLTYVRHPEESEGFHPYDHRSFEKTVEPPPGAWKLPELTTEQPVYALVALGDREHLLVLDRQQKKDSFYNRLYFDANANRDLTDDPVLDGTIETDDMWFIETVFAPVDTRIVVDGESLLYSFGLQIYYYSDPSAWEGLKNLFGKKGREINLDNLYGYFRVNCSYTGEFEVDGQAYRVRLADSNVNGRFNDTFTLSDEDRSRKPIYGGCDSVYLTADHEIDPSDEQVLGDQLFVSRALFDVRVSTAEGKMTLTPVTGKALIPLRLGAKVERISLYTQDGKHCVMAYRPGETVEVPEGKYRLLAYQTFRNDAQGGRWRLSAVGTADSPFVALREGVGAVLPFGEPYSPVVEVPERSLENLRGGAEEVELQLTVEGKGKEVLTDLWRVSGPTTVELPDGVSQHRPPEPTYKIVKADGEVVAQGAFEYG